MEYHALILQPWHTGTFWVAIAIVIFLLIFGRRLSGALLPMLDNRAATIRAALDEAAQLKAEAEALLADARSRQTAATEDAKQILAFAHAEAVRIAEELAKEAEATAKRRERMALDRITAAEKAALHEVRAAAIDIAAAASAALLRDSLSPEADAAMIDHAIAGVPAALRAAV